VPARALRRGRHRAAHPPAAFFLLPHLAGVALAAAGAWLAARRIRRSGDLVGQVLLAAIAVSLAAFLVTERVVDSAATGRRASSR
jgi:hypothetical protein